MSTMTVEVLSVSRAADGATGEELISVQFGKVYRNVKENQNMPAGLLFRQPVSLVMTLFFKFDEVAPYRVGTRWSLTVSEEGSIQLKEEKR